MKRILLTAMVLFFVVTSVTAQQAKITYHDEAEKAKSAMNDPVAMFDKTVYDFGEIVQGVPKTATFTLKNEGKEPLLIEYARASCGCTNLTYEKEPVLPGKSTKISVTYNAAAPGPFMKTVTVRTNANKNQVVLQIKGTVIAKGQPQTETKKP